MSLIASLAVGLVANTQEFTAKMMAARTPVNELAKSVEASSARMSTLGGALEKVGKTLVGAVVAAGAAVAGLTVHGFELVDSMGKLSERLGVSTEDLAGIKLAADVAGVSFEGLTIDLQKLTKGLGDPKGEFKESLDKLSLSADQLRGKGIGEQLRMIANQFAQLTSTEDQAAIAVALFGRQGQALIPLLKQGAAGLDESAKKADALGASFSKLDAEKVEEAHKSIIELKTAFVGLGEQIAILTSGPLKAFVDRMTSMMETAHKWKELFATIFNNATANDSKARVTSPEEDFKGQLAQDAMADNFKAQLQDDQAAAKVAEDAMRTRMQELAAEGMSEDANQKSMELGEWRNGYDANDYDTGKNQALKDLADGLKPFADVADQFRVDPQSPIAAAAFGGTRGTFAADSANRLVGSASIPQRQLDTLKSIDKNLDKLNTNFADGVPVG